MTSSLVTECSCGDPHDTFPDLARCLFPDAVQVAGTGPYALIVTPAPGRRPTVILFTWVDDTLDAKLQMDGTARRLKTGGTTEIRHLHLTAIEAPA